MAEQSAEYVVKLVAVEYCTGCGVAQYQGRFYSLVMVPVDPDEAEHSDGKECS